MPEVRRAGRRPPLDEIPTALPTLQTSPSSTRSAKRPSAANESRRDTSA